MLPDILLRINGAVEPIKNMEFESNFLYIGKSMETEFPNKWALTTLKDNLPGRLAPELSDSYSSCGGQAC